MAPSIREIVGEENYKRLQEQCPGRHYIPKIGHEKQELVSRNEWIINRCKTLRDSGLTRDNAIDKLQEECVQRGYNLSRSWIEKIV